VREKGIFFLLYHLHTQHLSHKFRFQYIFRIFNSPIHDGDEANDSEEEEDIRIDFGVQFIMRQ
jgi:hypothetical protein